MSVCRSGGDINDCRLKLILGFIWTLILRYQIHQGADGTATDVHGLAVDVDVHVDMDV